MMHELAVCLSWGACSATAIACYLWGRSIKGKADYFSSITRVVELKGLDDLLKEKTMNPLVVVSGRVASAAPFKCKDNGSFESVFDVKAQVDLESKLVDGFLNGSLNFLARLNQTPWYLEDGTGRVKVVGFEDAVGFYEALKEYVDISESEVVEVLKKLVSPNYSIEEASKVFDAEGSKVLHGSALNIGTSLTFVGEAVRDKAGNLMIQEPKEHPFMVFSGEGSFDKMVDKIKSDSEFYIFYSKVFGTIAVAVAVMYGVDFIRRWKKKKSGNK